MSAKSILEYMDQHDLTTEDVLFDKDGREYFELVKDYQGEDGNLEQVIEKQYIDEI